MITVMFYFKKGDDACDEAGSNLLALKQKLPFDLIKVDITEDETIREVYQSAIPVVQVGPYLLKRKFSLLDLEVAIRSAIDREEHLEKAGDLTHQRRIERGHRISIVDRVAFWLSRHYMSLINFLLVIFVGLAFSPPFFMKAGMIDQAKTIYTIYSPLCHQLVFRSWFLLGEQAYYPRTLAHIPGVKSIETILNIEPEGEESDYFILVSRDFLGDDVVGYKTALCQRDIAIYMGILGAGLIFSLRGKRDKPIKWMLWLLVGVVPIAIDGFSQFPSLISGLPNWLPVRESTPILRVITGGLFGITTGWYLFPVMEESMKETRTVLYTKFSLAKQTTQNEG